MFTQGFEKIAVLAPIVGRAAGYARRGVTGTVKGVKSFAAGQKQKFRAGRGAAYGRETRVPGEGLYSGQARRMAAAGRGPTASEGAAMHQKAKAGVKERYSQMKDYQKSKKKSFASKHPFLTAGGLYLGARFAMGGGDQQQSPPPGQPQVIPGQY